MQRQSPIELEGLEVYLQPSMTSQQEWNIVYSRIKEYIKNLADEDIVLYPEKTTIDRIIKSCHIHIQIKRSFTTDVILLYRDLSDYLNQEETLILLAVANEHGKVSTPLIIDLIVLIESVIPGTIIINGYLHTSDWGKSLQRLQNQDMLFFK
ncbi:hypothetical protein D7Z54_18755 [Salibacterium salarium]|uniref:Uncharacterized protein n=1 Tax=Salibacterium salarium TaxID=284579 RepID=A0A3R9WR59_9BACI|nr:hypothetical protein [Salibacterium salarium]RSL31839.1 hypothetical protein D7Z54_18755 [Salibacterium salarium]